ncbi:MAG: glycoside hydrolase family 99-like domain-containing protein [Desulfuromonadales bacterium]|nr:glycoside hydrolase family 99-like domain-containing protein [Desulfuromonadales bacterium]
MSVKPRLIAFHLPQFHPIPENDAWWGQGFTEWRTVAAAKPLFKGHSQPNVPADLGFYDLRLPEARNAQALLAKQYGIEGFCYWHYWFNGKLLLETPVQEIISSGEPDMPFCLAWANEPWSRRWHGRPEDILQDQTYGGVEDDRRHFEWLLPALADPRAIRIDGKPVFLVYKAKSLPDCRRTTDLWRELAVKNGLPGLYLLSIETDGTFGWDPRQGGFDAAVEYQPYWLRLNEYLKKNWLLVARNYVQYRGLWVLDYGKLWPHLLSPEVGYPLYRGVCPRWDNTPRKGPKGIVFSNSTSEEYGKWLSHTIQLMQNRPEEHRIVFINAWNEWGEGNYLEPDLKYGHAYLEATRAALTG